MADGYFKRNATKKGTKKGAGRPITYGAGIDDQLLVWLLDACDKQLPITSQVLKAKALELISPTHPEFKASDGWVQNSSSGTLLFFVQRYHLHRNCQPLLRKKSQPLIPNLDS